MVARIDSLFQELNHSLLGMGALAETAIAAASDALFHQDIAKARETIHLRGEARRLERDIEGMCLRLLLREHPVAKDLRAASAALKMITDLERICDQSADIADIVVCLIGEPYIKRLEHLPQMAEGAMDMVHTALDAYVRQDAAMAASVAGMDDYVDNLFNQVKAELIDLVHKDPANGGQAIDLLMIAKYLERIADHAQLASEWVEFAITGVLKEEKQGGVREGE